MNDAARYIVDNGGMVVSEATHRTDDLLGAFTEVLEELAPDAAAALKAEYPDVYAWLESDRSEDDILDSFGDAPADLRDDASYLVNEDLFEKLNEHAPDGYSFGSHEGDGACFGFWADLGEE